jgi:hypothetical protein
MTQMHAGVRVSKKRVEVPLHLYLTEQVEEVVTNVESTQTDTFIEEVDENAFEQRYIPAKTGVDSGTQVDNSLVFVYERDVKPILSTVVSKTLQQALMEVVEEEEIEFMRRKHVAMEDDDAEAAQNQSERVQDERVLADAMAAKLRAKREAKNATASIVDKVASANFAQHFFRHLQRDALAVLDDQNFFPDPVVDAVEAALPAIYAEVKKQVSAHVQTQKAVEDLIRAGLAALTVEVQNTAADYRAKKAIALELEAAKSAYNKARAVRRMKVFLYIHSEETGRIGPVVLRGDDTIADVTSSVVKILQDKADDIDSEFEAPAVERLSFLYNDRVLQPDDILCNLGVANLGSLRMNVEPLPEPEPEVTETEGEEDDEDATATETEDTEGDNTETDYTDSTEYTDTTA